MPAAVPECWRLRFADCHFVALYGCSISVLEPWGPKVHICTLNRQASWLTVSAKPTVLPSTLHVIGFHRCGNNSSIRLFGCVGSRVSTSLR